jgi:hypothetical protein
MTDREIIASNLKGLPKKELKDLFDEKNENYARFGILFVEEAMRRARQDQDAISTMNERDRLYDAIHMQIERISRGEGAFSRDRLVHAENCIEEMKSFAKEVLEILLSDGNSFKIKPAKPVCPRCWCAGQIDENCPECHGSGEKTGAIG